MIIIGEMWADLISSSISVDGSNWIKSALTGDKTYAGNQEYSAQISTPEYEILRCMFARSDDETSREEEIETRGILASGNYTVVQGISEDLTVGSVDITGSGLVSLSKKTGTVNWTQEERSVKAGRMNVSEYGEYGGES